MILTLISTGFVKHEKLSVDLVIYHNIVHANIDKQIKSIFTWKLLKTLYGVQFFFFNSGKLQLIQLLFGKKKVSLIEQSKHISAVLMNKTLALGCKCFSYFDLLTYQISFACNKNSKIVFFMSYQILYNNITLRKNYFENTAVGNSCQHNKWQ